MGASETRARGCRGVWQVKRAVRKTELSSGTDLKSRRDGKVRGTQRYCSSFVGTWDTCKEVWNIAQGFVVEILNSHIGNSTWFNGEKKTFKVFLIENWKE